MSYQEKIYNNYIDKNGDPDYFKVHKANQESYEDNFRNLLPINKNASILEIGCGAGQLLFFIKSLGYSNIVGIDIGKEQVEYINKMGIKGTVISSIQEYLHDKYCYYDAIIMNQVIEHISKDELLEVLKAIRSSLKDDGIFVFITPNMACLSGLFQRYIDYTHEIGFTERSANQVMRIAGFSNVKISGDIIKLKLRPQRIAWWLCNKLWYAFLGFAYYMEKGMDRPKVLSRDLIVVCKK